MQATLVAQLCVPMELLLPMIYEEKGGESVKKVSHLGLCAAIDKSCMDFKGALSSVDDMVSDDKDHEQIKDIMRLKEALVSTGDAELEKEGVCKKVLDEAITLIAQVQQCVVERHWKSITEAADKMEDVAMAAKDESSGLDWTGGVDIRDMPFAGITKLAEDSGMMSWDGKECDEAMKSLTKANASLEKGRATQ